MFSFQRAASTAIIFSFFTTLNVKASNHLNDDVFCSDGDLMTTFALSDILPEEQDTNVPSASLPKGGITLTTILSTQVTDKTRRGQLLDAIATQTDNAAAFDQYKVQLNGLGDDALEIICSQGVLKHVLGNDSPLNKAEGWLKKARTRKELRLQKKFAFPLSTAVDKGAPPKWYHAEEDQSFLTDLEYSGSVFGFFPQEIFSFTTLTKLNLSDAGLVVLPSQIASLENLVALDLTGNSLFWIAPEVGSMTLQELYISGNPKLKKLPETLGQSELKVLVIDHQDRYDAPTQQLLKALVGRGLKIYVPGNDKAVSTSSSSSTNDLPVLRRLKMELAKK